MVDHLVNSNSYFSLFAHFAILHSTRTLLDIQRPYLPSTYKRLIKQSVPLFYRSFERTTPILFEKLVTKSVDDAFMREKRELFDKATTSCLPSVIRMGRDLHEEDLQQHISFFRESLLASQVGCQAFIAAIATLPRR